jgi:uncharacterized protein
LSLYLRPHHLLCILTYRGYGYGEEFVANFSAVVAQISAGAEFFIRRGPDAICAPLCNAQPRTDFHCDELRVYERDDAASAALMPYFGDAVLQGRKPTRLAADLVQKLRADFKTGAIRQACTGCQWHAFCTEIAEQDFSRTHLAPPQN